MATSIYTYKADLDFADARAINFSKFSLSSGVEIPANAIITKITFSHFHATKSSSTYSEYLTRLTFNDKNYIYSEKSIPDISTKMSSNTNEKYINTFSGIDPDGYNSSISLNKIIWGNLSSIDILYKWKTQSTLCPSSGYYDISDKTTHPGNSTITCRGLKTLTVEYEEINTPVIPVTSITLNPTSLTLGKGETSTISATVYPPDATEKAVEWYSDNTSVATVDSNGKVTTKSAGSATITCTAADGSGKYATCEVTVIVKITSISIPSSYSMVVGDSTTLSPVTIKPPNATNQNLLWGTYNEEILTVDGHTGKITAKKPGTAEVDASAQDGSGITSNRCVITVSSQIIGITSISLNKTSITLKKGNSTDLSYTPNPSNASIESVRWVSNNPSIASVNDNGKVTALNSGEAEISCYVTDKKEKEVSASCLVVIETDPPETSTKHVDININGTYVPAVAWIKIGGIWKKCTAVYVNKNGNWYKANAK